MSTEADLHIAVAQSLGMRLDPAEWSSQELARINLYIQEGLGQFFRPALVGTPHTWSFLEQEATLTTEAAYSTGTVQVSSGTCTLTGGTWPAWAATHGILVIDTVEYDIVSRDSDQILTVVGADVDAGTTYTLTHDEVYDLPYDCHGVVGDFFFDTNTYGPRVQVIGEAQVRAMYQGTRMTGKPQYGAVRPIMPTAYNATRFQAVFWPTPTLAYNLLYAKRTIPRFLTVQEQINLAYVHWDTLMLSCQAVAERRDDDAGADGPYFAAFMRALAASVADDQLASTPRRFGYNADRSDDPVPQVRRPYRVIYRRTR